MTLEKRAKMLASLITELPLNYNDLYGQILVTLREVARGERALAAYKARQRGTGLGAVISDAILMEISIEESHKLNSPHNPFRNLKDSDD